MYFEEIRKSNSHLWDVFTLKEEYSANLQRDLYNRFPYYLSKNREVLDPIVSQEMFKSGYHLNYPNGKKFAICLTHDIDYLFNDKKLLLRRIISNLSKFKFRTAYNDLSVFKNNRYDYPVKSLSKIIDIEKKYKATSSFYFLSLDSGETDYNYDVSLIRDIFQLIQNNKSEIGLHGGHLAYIDKDKLRREKNLLEENAGSEIIGYRNHYLRFITPLTWNILSKVGFKYDTTLGYADMIGFRNGMCYPFHPYSLDTQEFLPIVEIPLNIMEVTLFRYMQLSEDTAFQYFKDLVMKVKKIGGVLTLLWHNSSNIADLDIYEKYIDYCQSEDGWLTSAVNLLDWYSHKSLISKPI